MDVRKQKELMTMLAEYESKTKSMQLSHPLSIRFGWPQKQCEFKDLFSLTESIEKFTDQYNENRQL